MKAPAILRTQLRLARANIDDLVSRPDLPALGVELSERILEASARLEHRKDMKPRSRTYAVQASAFTANYMWDFVPLTWTYAGPDTRKTARGLDAGALRDSQQAFHPLDPRLSWRTPDGRLVFDELHATDLNGGLLCQWMRRRITGDIELGQHIAGDDFAGVRLLSLRYPNRSLWVTRLDDPPEPLREVELGQEGGLRR